MKRNKLQSSVTGRSLTSGIVVGIVAASLLSVLLTALLTNIVLSNNLRENSIDAIVFLIRAISLLVGVLFGAMVSKKKHLQLVGFAALGYLLMLIGTGIVFYDGNFKHFLSGVASVLLGGIAALAIIQRPKGRSHRGRKLNL